MLRPQATKAAIPMLDICVGGVFLPRGKAVPLIVQFENARELRKSGAFTNMFGGKGKKPTRSDA